MAEEIVQLPNVPAEYHYIQRLTCEKCGQAMKGDRHGSRASEDGRMHDLWTVTCTSCGASKKLTLSVPTMDIMSMFGLNKKNG